MSNEIVKSVSDINAIADYAFNSGVMNITNKSQAVMKILAGQEMGLGVFASLSNIHIIQDKPVIGANLMAAAVKSSGRYDYRFIEFTDKVCDLMFFEKRNGAWVEVGNSRFSLDDAAKAQLLDKKNKDGSPTNWERYPKNMLFARAISNGVRWYCPDLFSGNTVYTEGELDADTVDGSWTEAKAEPEPLSINELIKQFGAAAVLEAMEGRAVDDDDPEQLKALREKLETEYSNAV